MDERLSKILGKLQIITAGCRPDMNEPDEQNLEATVVGDYLNNANGNAIVERLVEQGAQEYVVCLKRLTGTVENTKRAVYIDQFNLADLIALARLAK